MSVATAEAVRLPNADPKAEMALLLQHQREAHLHGGPPDLAARRARLGKLLAAVRANEAEIVAAIAADFGSRSRHETLMADIMPVVNGIKHSARHLKRWMKPQRAPVALEFKPARARVVSQPLGVVGIISPWNYPFHLAILPLAQALAAGNRVMLKPSELTPRTAELMARMLGECFAPDEVAVVLGGPDVGQAFAALPFDHLLYTGSTKVGALVMRAAAENLVPVTLELGGKSPAIVGEDADLDRATASIMFGKLLNSGQTCIAPDYVLLPETMREAFVARATAAVKKMYPTLARNPDYTAIVNDRHYRRLAGYLDEAKAKGARAVELNPAAEPLDPAQRKLAPTLLLDADDALAVMQDEIFGPILPVRTYRTLDEAIDYVNRRPRPLALYYFGRGDAGRDRVLARTTSGGVAVNETLMHVAIDDLPFGGVGPSGMGAYHGRAGFDAFSHRKSVFLQSRLNGAWMLFPPFGRLTEALLGFMLRK